MSRACEITLRLRFGDHTAHDNDDLAINIAEHLFNTFNDDGSLLSIVQVRGGEEIEWQAP